MDPGLSQPERPEMSDPVAIPHYEPENYFLEDEYFSNRIQSYLPETEWPWARPYLEKMGKLAAREWSPLALEADQNPPHLVQFNSRGERIDEVRYHESYRRIAKGAYEFGILGLGESPEFKKQGRSYSPMLKFGLGYLFSQSGSVLYCPICMTDGTIQLLRRHAEPTLKEEWLPRLTSMNFETFADGGMYLTEAQGGSDVGSNSTVARKEKGHWLLSGKKWFCSNAGSETALVLARPEGAPTGTRGLGLFLLPRHRPDNSLNAIHIDRIKPKLGTCEMATAEITLAGALAYPVGELAEGFAYMTGMLNLSRIYNAVWSIGLMQRAWLEARYYAQHRQAFGHPIAEYPLVAQTLAQMKQASHQALDLTLETLYFMDRLERGAGGHQDELLLRLLTPVVKFFTAEQAIQASHQAVEILGGNGCIEDFPVAKLLRDSQILAIWEGTANILSLDLLRVVQKSEAPEQFLAHYQEQLRTRLPEAEQMPFRGRLQELEGAFRGLREGQDGHHGQLDCRKVAWKLAQFLQELAGRLR